MWRGRRCCNWFAKFGIVLVIDPLAAIMLTLSTLITAASVIYGFTESSVRIEHPLRLPLVQFLVGGFNLPLLSAPTTPPLGVRAVRNKPAAQSHRRG